ncbi:MAG: putative collagen-binding domain-containing protein, partial [Anaerolineales bacterium]
NPRFPLVFPNHQYCDEEHTRRGAWRGAFCGLGIIHGFENSWGPFADLENDQPGLEYLLHLHRFLTEVVSFEELAPAPELVASGEHASGERPLALASAERDVVAVYLPVGGEVFLDLSRSLDDYAMEWFDPCSGELAEATGDASSASLIAPRAAQNGHPQDWVLLLRAGE